MDDIVIEFKLRIGGLDYDQARLVREALRNPGDVSTLALVDELRALARDIAPEAHVSCFSPWAEWRPAQGKRQRNGEVA